MIRRLLAAAAVLSLAAPLVAGPLSSDAALGLANRFRLAWNQHDMAAMAELFTADADFVNVGGLRLKGREQIRSEHARRHEMQFKESVLSLRSVDGRLLKPDVALVHLEWEMKGERDSDGTSRPARSGLMTWVVVRQGRDWRIAASHNTNMTAPQ